MDVNQRKYRIPVTVRDESENLVPEATESGKALQPEEAAVAEVAAPQKAEQEEPIVARGAGKVEEPSVTPEGTAEQEEKKTTEEEEDYKDLYLRARAEMVNFRRRMEKLYADRAEAEKRRLLRAFLAVADNLERALQHGGSGDGLREGVELTYQSLQQLLSAEGVEPIEAVGKPFDPQYHEAVDVVPARDEDDGLVMDEVQKGYLYKGELLRPARVRVARAAR